MSAEIAFALLTGAAVIGLGVVYMLVLKREFATSFVLDNIDDYTEMPEEVD